MQPSLTSDVRPEPLLEIRDLTVEFDGTRVVHGVDLDVGRGECLGLVGESGCGKSVTWLAVLGLLGSRTRVAGSVRFDGSEILGLGRGGLNRLRGRRMAMIFQDPTSALNPVLTIGRQIREALRMHRGLGDRDAKAEAKRLLDRVGIAEAERRLSQYPHELSGGTNQRVMIAIALAGEPEVLIADEPTTALDVTIQAQILELLHDLRKQTGMAMVLVSHDLGVVAEVADRVAVMYAGDVVELAPTGHLFETPRHPYTRGLLDAVPDFAGPKRRLTGIPGTVPPAHQRPTGCSFASRCALANEICTRDRPRLSPGRSAGDLVACHHTARCDAEAAE